MATLGAVAAVLALVGFVTYAVVNATHVSRTLGSQPALQLVPYAPSHQTQTSPTVLKALGGGPSVTVGGATGSPSVVNFFASWCPACRKELSADAAVARSGGVRFIGVDTDDSSPGAALALLHKAGAAYPVGIGNANLAQAYGTGNLPTTAFLNRQGRIVAIALGAVPQAQLATWVHDLATGKSLSASA